MYEFISGVCRPPGRQTWVSDLRQRLEQIADEIKQEKQLENNLKTVRFQALHANIPNSLLFLRVFKYTVTSSRGFQIFFNRMKR